jgi:hypothetical protein
LLLSLVSCNSFNAFLSSTCSSDVSQAIIFVAFFLNKISTINKKKEDIFYFVENNLKVSFSARKIKQIGG